MNGKLAVSKSGRRYAVMCMTEEEVGNMRKFNASIEAPACCVHEYVLRVMPTEEAAAAWVEGFDADHAEAHVSRLRRAEDEGMLS